MNLNHTFFVCLEDEERDYLRKRIDHKTQELLTKAMEHRVEMFERPNESALENPNWPLLRAFRDGRLRELLELVTVFKPT